jgi:hypothetical protein
VLSGKPCGTEAPDGYRKAARKGVLAEFPAIVYGWPVELIGFERGLALRLTADGWAMHCGSKAGPVFIDPNDFATHLRPVLLMCRPAKSAPLCTLLYKPDKPGFRQRPQQPWFELIQRHGLNATVIPYLSGSLIYHVQNLHARYVAIRNQFKNMFGGLNLDDGGNFMNQPEPYYEFDALLAAAQRAYNSCSPILWNFCSGTSRMPTKFDDALHHCTKLDLAILNDLKDR